MCCQKRQWNTGETLGKEGAIPQKQPQHLAAALMTSVGSSGEEVMARSTTMMGRTEQDPRKGSIKNRQLSQNVWL